MYAELQMGLIAKIFATNNFHLRVKTPFQLMNKLLQTTPSYQGAGLAPSVWRLATGRTAESSNPGRVKNFLHVVQIGSGAHPVSYPMGTGDFFPLG
jgi:hypothetical protein